MASVEKLLLEIRTDLRDLKSLRAELKTIKQEAGETGKSIGDSLKAAATGIAAGFTLSKIKGVTDGAVGEFNKLEKTMLGLNATAKLTGTVFDDLRKQVKSLSSDGVLSLDQSTTAMKTLLAQGFEANKAFQLLDASKRVSAFNNIVGDAGQGVADFVKFLQTGSAELAENMDPSIIKVVKSLGGYAKVSTDTAAKMKLVNAVIEKGAKLNGDYEKYLESGTAAQVRAEKSAEALAQTLGQKLQPAYNTLLRVKTTIINALTAIVESLESTTVAAVAFGTMAFIGLATFAKGAALLPGVIGGIGASITAALVPIGIFIAAISAAIIAWNNLFGDPSKERAMKNANEQKKSLEELFSTQEKLSKINNRTAEEEKRLALNKAELRKQAKALGIDFDELVKKAGSYEKALKAISKAAVERAFAEENAPLLAKRARVADRVDRRLARRTEFVERYGSAAWTDTEEDAAIRRGIAELADIDSRLVRPDDDVVTPATTRTSGGAGGITGTEQRFTETQRKLLDIEKNRLFTIASLSNKLSAEERARRIEAANDAARMETEQERGRLRGVFAEYIEDETMAKQEALKQQTADTMKASKQRLEAELLLAGKNEGLIQQAKEENEKRLQKIREVNARKAAQITLESFAQTMQAANATTSGFAQMLRARDIGSALSGQGALVSGLSGLKELFPALGALGPAGQAIGAVGGIVSTLSGLFGKSDEERQREAEAQKRRDEEAKAILELQANYQKDMLALQEAAARFPFEELTRKLRLIDIQAQQKRVAGADEATIERERLAARQTAVQDVLNEESATISEGRLFAGTAPTAEGLTKFLSERASQALAIQKLTSYVQMMQDQGISFGRLKELAKMALSLKGQVPNELMTPLENDFNAIINSGGRSDLTLSEIQDLQNDTGIFAGLSRATYANYGDARGAMLQLPIRQRQIAELTSEITRDTTTGEDLLSVIEQSLQAQLDIEKHTKATSENTAKLNLLDERRRSVLDLGNRRIFSQGFNIDFQNLQLPQTIASTILAATPAPVLTSDTVSELRKVVAGIDEANEWLAIIASNTDGRTATNSGDLDNYLIEKLKAIRSRRLS